MDTKDMEIKQYLFGSMFLLSNKLQVLGDAYLEDVTLKQWFLLIMIRNFGKQRLSVTEAAGLVGSSRQNVRKMLETLAAEGYVELSVNARDKRTLAVSLTSQALNFFTRFEAKGNIFLERLFSGVNSEWLESGRKTFEVLFQNMERMEKCVEKDCGTL